MPISLCVSLPARVRAAWTWERDSGLIPGTRTITLPVSASATGCRGDADGGCDVGRSAAAVRCAPRSLGPVLALDPRGECAHARLLGLRDPDGASAAVLGQGGQRSHTGALRAADQPQLPARRLGTAGSVLPGSAPDSECRAHLRYL